MSHASRQTLLDEAIGHLEQAVRQAPGNPRYAALLGEACLLRGEPDAALAPLQGSFQTEPHPRTAYLLALALLRLQRLADAEAYASAALEEAAGFHRAHAVRAVILRTKGDLRGAIVDLREAVALAPESECYRLLLPAFLLEAAGREEGEDGAALLSEARRQLLTGEFTGHRDAWHYLAGLAVLQAGDAPAALDHFAQTGFPSEAEVALRTGVAHLRRGAHEEAVLALRRAGRDPAIQAEAAPFLARALEGRGGAVPPGPAPRIEALTEAWLFTTEHAESRDHEVPRV